MDIKSSAFTDGRIGDKYGSRGKDFKDGMPALSFPFSIEDAPEGTVTFAVIFDDYDSVPICGFPWTHWLISGLRKTEVQENASRRDTDLIQGINSWHSCAGNLSAEKASTYGGPAPPNGPHMYNLKVFALNYDPGLKRGFGLDEMMNSLRGHTLEHAVMRGRY